jgi:ATP-binding cassette subfamily C (CFTR/MRP) protein 4
MTSNESRPEYMHVYVGLVGALMIVTTLQGITFACFARLASANLHNKMFNIIMRAPMNFFERNPVGRVLNRFTRDMGFVDDPLPNQAHCFITVSLKLLRSSISNVPIQFMTVQI